jgi:hypothetical protein
MIHLTDSRSVFHDFSLLLFILTFISLLPLHKYLLKLVRGTILLFVLDNAVRTFFAIILKEIDPHVRPRNK